MRMRATDVAGNTHDIEVVNPLGHEANPVSSAELAMKFRRLCTGTLSPEAIDAALATWWSIEKHTAQSLLDCLVLPLSRPHTCGHRYRTQPSSNPKVDEP
jgi:2-methylcitrate dehydratase PrpD